MNTLKTALVMILAALLLAGCQTPKREKSLDETLRQYENMVRWSEWDGASSFIAPEYLEEHPITRLDLDRLRLFRVTSYTIRSATPIDGGDGFLQAVEIRMFNRNQAVERVVLDQQEWRYDAEREQWLLHTGLPDVTKRY
ncbi:MAG: hypothetical protein P8008_03585 [Gammaproteobacteria bacterium]